MSGDREPGKGKGERGERLAPTADELLEALWQSVLDDPPDISRWTGDSPVDEDREWPPPEETEELDDEEPEEPEKFDDEEPEPPAPAETREPAEGRAGVPVWAPEGFDLHFVPEPVQQAIREVVDPVYERFVRGVDDPLELSLGVTVAHLLWLEVLQQYDLKREYTEITAVLGLRRDRSSAIEQHLRIIQSKVQVGYLMARLRDLRQKGLDLAPEGEAIPEAPARAASLPPVAWREGSSSGSAGADG